MIKLHRSKHYPLCLKVGLLLCSIILIGQRAVAYELAEGSHLHGFAHHTLLWTDNNDFIVDTDDQINHAITDIGLTLNHQFNRYWHFSGQINSHKAGETNDGDVDLDFAYLQWRLIDSNKQKLNLLTGRVVMRYGLFNEIRDVTHSRSSIFVPYSIYYDRFRSLIFSHDGVGFDYKYFKGFDHIRIDGAIATPRGTEEEVSEVLPTDALVNGKSDGQESYYLRTSYEQPLQARYMLSSVFLRYDYDGDFALANPATGSIVGLLPISGGFELSSTGFSTQQFINQYTLTLELFRHHVEYQKLLVDNSLAAIDLELDLNAAYLQVQAPCGPLLCMVQYEMLETLESDLSPSTKTEDAGIGIALHLDHNFMLRAEVHKIDGTAWLRDPTPNSSENWTYAATQLAWKF